MRRVKVIWPNNTESTYDSVKQAAYDIGCSQQAMSKALKNNRIGHMNIDVRYED